MSPIGFFGGGSLTLLTQGLDANKGSPQADGRMYFAYDTGILYRDNGVAWIRILRGGAPNFNSFMAPIFGNGSLGDVIISVNTNLSSSGIGVKVVQYHNLTINSGVTLSSDPSDSILVILCTGILTLNGTISMVGRGKTGGAGGAAMANGNPGTPGGLVSALTYSGNMGGNGDSAGGTTGALGGLNSISPALQSPLPFEIFRGLIGSGGGGGGGASASYSGGNGGQGGGIVWIEANSLVYGASALIDCHGNNGNPGTGVLTVSGGGGGGGNAGSIQILYSVKTGLVTLTVAGGNGGAIGGSGSDATYGTAGHVGIASQFQV